MWHPLDWGTPWYEPWRDPGLRVEREVQAGQSLRSALNRHAAAPVRFVAQSQAPSGLAYEQYIFETGNCPTRDNLHDFFNGLVWNKFALAKRRLNQLQAAGIARQGANAPRGALRDAITVFDENGALLDAPPPLWSALLARDWRRLFIDLRPLWAQARLRLFGHALLEKLATPRKEITAHVWARPCPLHVTAEADAWLAGQFDAAVLARKPFTPLPLAGIPGWWAGNENFSFYDDSLVFRQPAAKT